MFFHSLNPETSEGYNHLYYNNIKKKKNRIKEGNSHKFTLFIRFFIIPEEFFWPIFMEKRGFKPVPVHMNTSAQPISFNAAKHT